MINMEMKMVNEESANMSNKFRSCQLVRVLNVSGSFLLTLFLVLVTPARYLRSLALCHRGRMRVFYEFMVFY